MANKKSKVSKRGRKSQTRKTTRAKPRTKPKRRKR